MKNKKIADILFTASFVVIVFLVAAVTIIKPKVFFSYSENRELASMPQYETESFLNGSFFDSVESFLKDHAPGRGSLLKLSTFVDMDVLQKDVVNGVIDTGNRLLAYQEYETVDRDAVILQAETQADSVGGYSRQVAGYGGQYLYVATPSHYAYFEDDYPEYLNNRSAYTDVETAAFFAALEGNGVEYIDMGAVFDSEGHPDEYYSAGDHHCTVYGAVDTWRAVVNEINSLTGLDMPVLTDEEMVYTTLDNPMLGSRSRKLFGLWDGGERMTVASPAVAVPFTRSNNGTEAEASVLSIPEDSGQTVDYLTFMGGDISETVIDTGRDELPDVLIYGDSYTNAFESVFYLSCGTMRSLDLRGYTEMTLREYIDLYRPDVVICVRDYEVMTGSGGNGQLYE